MPIPKVMLPLRISREHQLIPHLFCKFQNMIAYFDMVFLTLKHLKSGTTISKWKHCVKYNLPDWD